MTNSETSRVDIDDSQVTAITRGDGGLVIELEQRREEVAEKLTILVQGLSGEITEYYVGEKVTAPHPNPAHPLDYIEYAERGAGYLEIQGFRNGEPWYVWRIIAESIQIQRNSSDTIVI